MMGCSPGDDECSDNEKPAHRVRITKPFEMGKFEVTQAQWEEVMGSNPSRFKGPERPVENVSWNDVQEFLSHLNGRNDGYGYRLPTEAEWEYAARAGSVERFYGDLGLIAWYIENSGNQTRPVGQKQPNAWGLHDMLGNVWEWCADSFVDNYSDRGSDPVSDPKGPDPQRVSRYPNQRGGSWDDEARHMRVSFRISIMRDFRDINNGFRCVRERIR